MYCLGTWFYGISSKTFLPLLSDPPPQILKFESLNSKPEKPETVGNLKLVPRDSDHRLGTLRSGPSVAEASPATPNPTK